jgi:hypothetical protein
MTEKLLDVSPSSKEAMEPSQQPSPEELESARELVRRARSRGVALTRPDGLANAASDNSVEHYHVYPFDFLATKAGRELSTDLPFFLTRLANRGPSSQITTRDRSRA